MYRREISLFLGLSIFLATGLAADDSDAYLAGITAVKAGNYEQAFEQFETAINAEPNNLLYGTAYRQAIIAAAGNENKELYQRGIDFFTALAEKNPEAPNAFLNLAFVHVDKIPAEGAITQVILANTALGHFETALGFEETWLGYYSRGHAYLFWPTIFGRTPNGISDLEKAVELEGKNGDRKTFQSRAWAALGDGHWRLDDVDKAREIWQAGLESFPGAPELEARLALTEREKLDLYLEAHYETGNRVDTHLRELIGDEYFRAMFGDGNEKDE